MTRSINLFRLGLAAAAVAAATMGPLAATAAKAQDANQWCHYEILSISSDGAVDGVYLCEPRPGSGQAPAPAPGPHYPPCMIAQNAMRPCTSQQQPATPTGLDPQLVGVWKAQSPTGGFWVLQILANGTFKFHSEAHDGVPASSGSFAAGDGRWALDAGNGYTDGGWYSVQSRDAWSGGGGNFGNGTWKRAS